MRRNRLPLFPPSRFNSYPSFPRFLPPFCSIPPPLPPVFIVSPFVSSPFITFPSFFSLSFPSYIAFSHSRLSFLSFLFPLFLLSFLCFLSLILSYFNLLSISHHLFVVPSNSSCLSIPLRAYPFLPSPFLPSSTLLYSFLSSFSIPSLPLPFPLFSLSISFHSVPSSLPIHLLPYLFLPTIPFSPPPPPSFLPFPPLLLASLFPSHTFPFFIRSFPSLVPYPVAASSISPYFPFIPTFPPRSPPSPRLIPLPQLLTPSPYF